MLLKNYILIQKNRGFSLNLQLIVLYQYGYVFYLTSIFYLKGINIECWQYFCKLGNWKRRGYSHCM